MQTFFFYLVVYLILIYITVIYLQFSLSLATIWPCREAPVHSVHKFQSLRPKPLSIIIEIIFSFFCRLKFIYFFFFFFHRIRLPTGGSAVHRAWPNRVARFYVVTSSLTTISMRTIGTQSGRRDISIAFAAIAGVDFDDDVAAAASISHLLMG